MRWPMRRPVWRSVSIGGLLLVSAGVCAGWDLLRAHSRAPAPVPPPMLAVDLGDGVKMEFILIPKGTFMMGSPKGEERRFNDEVPHAVTITRPFYLAKYPVTQEQYQAIMGQNPSTFAATGHEPDYTDRVRGLDTKPFPVANVSWDMAQAVCKKLRDGDKQKRKFGLPTEAEWEYACRAGTKTAYFFGDDPGKLGDYAWFGDNSEGRTHRVGEKQPNAWGLHDMHGNV